MKRLLTATAAAILFAAPAFAQSTVTTGQDTRLLNQQTDLNDNDAALPGGSESGVDTGTTGSITSDAVDSRGQLLAPNGSSSPDGQLNPADETNVSPSGNIVPGQSGE